jgi:predicted DCC family thiol-disulfide oxidoreductase YuxK
MTNESGGPIVLYDGVCGLCDNFVQFVMRRDRAAAIRFAALQSETGKDLLRTFGLPDDDLSFIVVIVGKKSFIKSAAVLEVLRCLPGVWSYLALLRFFPAAISDVVYDFTARHRYRWFGKYESCVVPDESEKKRFLS